MKKITLTAVVVITAILAGCVVTSVQPFYTRKDLVFEPAIVGAWINLGNTNELWEFEQRGELAYRFALIESDKATVMEARAFKLEGQLFLDIFSLEQDYHVIPAHYLLKVAQVEPSLKLSEMDDAWLIAYLDNKPNALSHHYLEKAENPDQKRVVLTADTAELQSFIIRHLKTEGAWKECLEFRKGSGGRDLKRETARR